MILFFAQFSPARANEIFMEKDFPVTQSLGWDLLPNGMLVADYDLNGNGKADFYTLRRVERSFSSKSTPDNEARKWPGSLIFSVNYGGSSYYYVAFQHPLLYAVDFDEDGIWDLVFKDVPEDGLNGNEKFYDSPSGAIAAGKTINGLKAVLNEMCACHGKPAAACKLRE
ncbi:MAG: hypothetical protein HY579_00535 [Nitrospinae bacterium]|nr:hypothetical protein [Nitrospinota bacterium]